MTEHLPPIRALMPLRSWKIESPGGWVTGFYSWHEAIAFAWLYAWMLDQRVRVYRDPRMPL